MLLFASIMCSKIIFLQSILPTATLCGIWMLTQALVIPLILNTLLVPSMAQTQTQDKHIQSSTLYRSLRTRFTSILLFYSRTGDEKKLRVVPLVTSITQNNIICKYQKLIFLHQVKAHELSGA